MEGCICTWDHPARRLGLKIDPECPLAGHSYDVTQVEFSDDGAQAISRSEGDGTVRGPGTRAVPGGMCASVPGMVEEGLTWVGCAGLLLGRRVRHAGAPRKGRWLGRRRR